MQRFLLPFLFSLLALTGLFSGTALAQPPLPVLVPPREVLPVPVPVGMPNRLYVNKAEKKTSQKTGHYHRKTDKYEHGSVKLTKIGPIEYNVKPADLVLETNSEKNWVGVLKADIDAAPEPGKMAKATLNADYDWTFSRPADPKGGGTVKSSHKCGGGIHCQHHPDGQGDHEIVNYNGTEVFDFEVYSLFLKIGDIGCDVSQDNMEILRLNAEVFPDGGTLTWIMPDGSKHVGNHLDLAVKQLGNPSFPLVATYEIDGVKVSDTKIVWRNKLTAFRLPCCVEKDVKVADIATLNFDGPCHLPVDFKPPHLSIPWLLSSSDEKVTASLNGKTLEAGTTMVNSDKSISITPLEEDFVPRMNEKFEKAFNVLFLNSPVSPCNRTGSPIPTGSLVMETGQICCPDKVPCVQSSKKISGALNWNYGLTCQFPIPGYSIPYFASIDAVISAGLSANLGGGAKTQCNAGFQFCLDGNASASLGGGVGVTLAAGAVEANLQLVLDGINVAFSICPLPPPTTGKLTIAFGKLKIKGSVTAGWGLTTHSVEIPLNNGFAPVDFQF
jgi:hypothetical protein